MKKKSIVLDKKLFLNKVIVADLNKAQQVQLMGGALTNRNCFTAGNTCPYTLCGDCISHNAGTLPCGDFACPVGTGTAQ